MRISRLIQQLFNHHNVIKSSGESSLSATRLNPSGLSLLGGEAASVPNDLFSDNLVESSVIWRVKASVLRPTAGTWDWTQPDAVQTKAATANKAWGLGVTWGINSPHSWLKPFCTYNSHSKSNYILTQHYDAQLGQNIEIEMPWPMDEGFHVKLFETVDAIIDRYKNDERFAFIRVAGLGRSFEPIVARDPDANSAVLSGYPDSGRCYGLMTTGTGNLDPLASEWDAAMLKVCQHYVDKAKPHGIKVLFCYHYVIQSSDPSITNEAQHIRDYLNDLRNQNTQEELWIENHTKSAQMNPSFVEHETAEAGEAVGGTGWVGSSVNGSTGEMGAACVRLFERRPLDHPGCGGLMHLAVYPDDVRDNSKKDELEIVDKGLRLNYQRYIAGDYIAEFPSTGLYAHYQGPTQEDDVSGIGWRDNGDDLAPWTDVGSNSLDLTSQGAPPKFYRGCTSGTSEGFGAKGQPFVQFGAGSNAHALNNSSFSISRPFTLHVVFRSDADPGVGVLLTKGNDYPRLSFTSTDNLLRFNGDVNAAVTVTPDKWHLLTLVVTDTQAGLTLDGGTTVTHTMTTQDWNGCVVGAAINSATPTTPGQFSVHEFLYYNVEHNILNGDGLTVRKKLNDRYGLEIEGL